MRFLRQRTFRVLLIVLAAAATFPALAQVTEPDGLSVETRSARIARQRERVLERLAELKREQASLEALLVRLDAGEEVDPLALPAPRPMQNPDVRPADSPLDDIVRSRPGQIEPPTRSWKDLTPDEQESLHEMAATLFPDGSDKLDELRDEDPDQYEKLMERNQPRLMEFSQLRTRDASMFELRRQDTRLARQTRQLARAAHEAESEGAFDQADEYERRLKELLAEHFDVRQRIRAYELDLIALRVRDLEEELALRSRSRGQLIEERLEQLLEAGFQLPDIDALLGTEPDQGPDQEKATAPDDGA
jgi:hypothetical protein